jgi:hypothetical protein
MTDQETDAGKQPASNDDAALRAAAITVKRQFVDGRRAEVVETPNGAVARVYAPSGRLYLETRFDTIGQATAAITLWDGDGEPRVREGQRQTEDA